MGNTGKRRWGDRYDGHYYASAFKLLFQLFGDPALEVPPERVIPDQDWGPGPDSLFLELDGEPGELSVE